MTEEEATAALGSDLDCADPTGDDGTVRGQDPRPGLGGAAGS